MPVNAFNSLHIHGFYIDHIFEKHIVLKHAIILFEMQTLYFCGGSFCFMSWCLKFFVLLAPYVCFHIFY